MSSVQLQPGKAIQSPRAGVLSAPGRQAYVYSLVLIILTIALYYPVKNHPFVNYDDDVYVTDNIQVQSGLSWDTVNWAFVTYDAGKLASADLAFARVGLPTVRPESRRSSPDQYAAARH